MQKKLYLGILYLTAAVWMANGLFCKILNFVPRHEQIVARILGHEHSSLFITLIGIGEVFMAIWIISRIASRLNAITQIALVLTMNVIEFILAPDLLLWGKLNITFACMFAFVVFYNEFKLKPAV